MPVHVFAGCFCRKNVWLMSSEGLGRHTMGHSLADAIRLNGIMPITFQTGWPQSHLGEGVMVGGGGRTGVMSRVRRKGKCWGRKVLKYTILEAIYRCYTYIFWSIQQQKWYFKVYSSIYSDPVVLCPFCVMYCRIPLSGVRLNVSINKETEGGGADIFTLSDCSPPRLNFVVREFGRSHVRRGNVTQFAHSSIVFLAYNVVQVFLWSNLKKVPKVDVPQRQKTPERDEVID